MLYVDKVTLAGRASAARQLALPLAAVPLTRDSCLPSPALSLVVQYRPKALEQFELHKDVAQNLQKLVRQRIHPNPLCLHRC